eukprot:1603788-Amphidinium_carterae.1
MRAWPVSITHCSTILAQVHWIPRTVVDESSALSVSAFISFQVAASTTCSTESTVPGTLTQPTFATM